MNNIIDQLSINTIRTLAIDGVQKAKSGHPGMPMGTAPMAYVLWTKFLKHNPNNSHWANRDRFVLSAGHGSMLLYSLLHLFGYKVSIEDLKNFRQYGSLTPGHPEYSHTDGVEITTGPLGQGFAAGVGMAIAEKILESKFNKEKFSLFNYYIYGIVGDGDLMEGISSEAASLAGHLGLGNLIYLYDDNSISIDGGTNLSFTENVAKRFESYNWHVQIVDDGNNLSKIEEAILNAQIEKNRPSLIKIKTHIGFGSPNKQDSSEAHGSPLGDEEIILTKENYNWQTDEKFFVPDEVQTNFEKYIDEGKKQENAWNYLLSQYKKHFPFDELDNFLNKKLPLDWEKLLPIFTNENGNIATREASGKVIESIWNQFPFLVGGSADLTPSNNTRAKSATDFQSSNYSGRYIRFGVREHAMGAILNGLALSGFIPFSGTFLVFSDYMKPAIRLASLMKLKVIYIFTHDSIGLGEDGPTHQPIEHLAMLRAIPGLKVIRPGDANETSEAWRVAINSDGPVALILTRQKLLFIDREKYASAKNLEKGGYILAESSAKPEIILIATGSENEIAIKAYEELISKGKNLRVVNIPSWELFELQSDEYKKKVLPPSIKKRIIIEAGSSLGWHRYATDETKFVTINHFGASAPASKLFEEFGFTVANIKSIIESF